ncbi:uncharacterized protein LOC128883629 isoform X2 [Hylaeus volcanicus]|uniref:uncharacterized protein LOC128883629 isoform X2 n=1 Tax=Hylaeus volcanicus TaxID=313075 RepID=UPI0023B812F2|nr:uncharacterized protein LOC128883629 isoform X2 [Hylaeus volcanicus]
MTETSLNGQAVVDIYGEIILPHIPILSTSQRVEVHIKKIYCISKAIPELPFVLRDANRKEQDNQFPDQISVKLDTRLDNRVLDLRTTANFHIFNLQSHVSRQFREFLYQENFMEIHTPKLIEGAAEGGSSVFTFSYFGNKACLAQSPQLHKQMAICADFPRVFEIGPVFRSENSNTHRHLCEFTGMDLEMVIQNSYLELVDMLDRLLKNIFSSLVSTCSEGIKEIHTRFPATPFQWIENTPKLSYIQGIGMLREAGFTDIPEDVSTYDLSTPMEKELGRLIKEKYNTDFYFLLKYPLKVRPFYTMPSSEDSKFSNSFDVFMRGEEIVSGAQRIHDIDILMSRLKEANIPPDTVQSYLNAFKLGVFPHGGCGIGLERVVMLFLGLDNIRRTSMFPRDPKRIQP